MGLVGPGTGWVVLNRGTTSISDDHLYWTNDVGNNWADVTPHDPASHEIAGALFLNASQGWVLLAARSEQFTGVSNVTAFDLAVTTDGGGTWSVTRLSSLPSGVGWFPDGEIFFLDSTHGWIDIETAVPHWGGSGVLLATTDGGKTWNQVVGVKGQGGFGGAPYGSIRFVDAQDGWIAGGTDGRYLYRTEDGGQHWAVVHIPPPAAILNLFKGGETVAQYAPPAFGDRERGFLSSTYFEPGAEDGQDWRALVLFSTADGGHTWHLESWKNLGHDRGTPAVTTVDSHVITARLYGHPALAVVKLGPRGEAVEVTAVEMPSGLNNWTPGALTFADANHGWAFGVYAATLLSTADGGTIWRNITPARRQTGTPAILKRMGAAPGATTPQSGVAAAYALDSSAGSTATSYKGRHMGFDACTLPSTAQMGTWWNSSPYFDIGIYLGGVNTKCATLKSSWISTVVKQGWSMIPIWVGPQAPCNNFAAYISTTGGAYAQGQTEADAATSAMGKVGLGPGSPVYYDIENYSPSGTCNGNPIGSYVNAFLEGWVSELQADGYTAGVYSGPAPAESWYNGGTGYGAVSPPPTDIWIADYDTRVTIWGLGFDDGVWPQDQRMHQYVGNVSPTWGGVKLSIDTDIEDADVVGGSGTKSYSFTYTTIDYPGACGTFAYGINNSGQIVGSWSQPGTGISPCDPAASSRGYLYTDGAFTNVDFPGAVSTMAVGINNLGTIVGQWMDQNSNTHGFLLINGSYSSLDYPNALITVPYGINDDNQIAG